MTTDALRTPAESQAPAENGPSAKDAEPARSVCIHCDLVLFDGLHRNGHRDCYMDEAPR